MKVLLLASIVLVTASAFAQTAPSTKPLHGQGCVQAGVEAGCMVVKDAKTGVLYNLLFKGSKPKLGVGIDFEGARFDGMTTCMQGAALQVSSWALDTTLKCQAPSAPSSSDRP